MQSFYNLKISTKLLISFAAVLTLTVVLGVFSILQLAKVNQTSVDLATNWMPSVRAVLEIKANIMRYRAQEAQHILSVNEDDMAKYEKRMADLMAELKKNISEYETLLSEPEEKATYAEFTKLWDQYMVEHDKIIKLSHGNKNEEARDTMRGESSRISTELANRIEKLAQINIGGGIKSGQLGRETYDAARAWIFATLCGSLVLGVLPALWIARIISRPLNEALQVAQTVAAGDLTSQIEAKSRDETGQLLRALKEMNTSLQNIVGEVRAGTDTIAIASTQIATGNLDLSSRTEQQASSLEETASSMEELTSTVKQNADNARQANQLAESASEVAVRGGEVVSQVVDTMGSINESAKKIVDIIGVIDGIAFQTNILALNAAVEAARAGEQGRGFAVVASEVRNLAQRSASAAKEIKSLIGDSVEKVEAGGKLVNQAGATMDEIVASVKRVTAIMGEITDASREQEAGIEQINQAISEMDTVTQQNASLVEEAAAAAQSMQEQASKLTQVVSVFKLGGAHAAAASAALPQRVKPNMPKVVPFVKQPRVDRIAAANAPRLKKVGNARANADGDWEQF